MPVNETYSVDWESPTATRGEWQRIVDHAGYGVAKNAADNEWNRLRRHARIVCHREGQEDVTVDERGPFNGAARAADK